MNYFQRRNSADGHDDGWLWTNNNDPEQQQQQQQDIRERELIARTTMALDHFMFMDNSSATNTVGQQSNSSLSSIINNNNINHRSLLWNSNNIDPVSFRRLATLAASVRDNDFHHNDNNSIRAAHPGLNQLWWALLLDSSFQFIDSIFFDDAAIDRQQRADHQLSSSSSSYKDKLTKEQQKDFLCNMILKHDRNPTIQSTAAITNDGLKQSSSPTTTTTCEKNCTTVSTKNNANISNEKVEKDVLSIQSDKQMQKEKNGNHNDDTIMDKLESDKSVSENQKSPTCCENSVHDDSIVIQSIDNEQNENNLLNCPICLDDIGK